MSALLWICFASIFIILLFVFVVENGHETCGPWDVQEPRSDDSWPLLLCQLHEATADQSERLQEEVGCQLWSVQIWWQWQVHYIYELNSGDLFVFVCYWQVQSLRTAEAAAAQKVQELQQLLAEASSDNPDSSRQEHVCGLLLWVATRRDAIESMRVA